MVKKKSKSSRQTLKQKYKIQKRVQEHDRKLRKLAKKGGKAPGKKFKDPGIPNSWPLKKELLEQVALAKEKAERKKVEDREARAEARKLAKAGGGSRRGAGAAQRARPSRRAAAAAAWAMLPCRATPRSTSATPRSGPRGPTRRSSPRSSRAATSCSRF
ncbi:GNL3L/Grn1 putative GTPase [Aureococcus anophagefferens]|nr:GNL3L/Grn1 putative GTPase [Aureococcus anophagefferens]